MEVEFFFEGQAFCFSNPVEILIGEDGRFSEHLSGLRVENPKKWLAEKSKKYFLAGAIGYECAWDFDDIGITRPASDGNPDFIVGLFTKMEHPAPGIPGDFVLTREHLLAEHPYVAAVQEAVESIFNGDIFEVNFTTQVTYEFSGRPDNLFCAMSRHNSGSWFATLYFDKLSILSCSPECFLSVSSCGKVRTDPIKGTELLRNRVEIQSEKNRAENVMIVDLMRNDLSRHCLPGSVVVSDLFREEEVGDLVHLVSTVEGQLLADRTPVELLCDCFPAGSITGAPKLAAIEIAGSLEQEKRGFYCGTMFYSKPDGELKSSVLIRTATLFPDKSKPHDYILKYGIGGAVVSDSDPKAEYEEALDKLGPIRKFVNDEI